MTAPALPATLAVEGRGEIAILWLARPTKRNALDAETIEGLRTFFSAVPAGVKAVVLAGEGGNFSAGLDLSEAAAHDMSAAIVNSRAWHRAFHEIEFGSVPVVAALHGAVIGGGLELACAAHLRVAERGAFYALPEGQRGIYVGGGASVRLPRLIGTARMMDMMLTGRTYGAEEGVTLGFSQYLVEAGEALPKAIALAERIAENAPLTNYALIHVLPRIAESDPATGYMTEALIAAIAQTDPQARARLADFLEKRAAKVTHG